MRYKKGYFVKETDKAIKKIETNKVKRHGIQADAANSIANVNYTGLWGIRMRLYQLFWELDYNQRGGKTPIGYSVMMKLEFWKTAVNIIRDHPISDLGHVLCSGE